MRNNHPIDAGNDGKMSWTIPRLTAHSPVFMNHFFSVNIRTNIRARYWEQIMHKIMDNILVQNNKLRLSIDR